MIVGSTVELIETNRCRRVRLTFFIRLIFASRFIVIVFRGPPHPTPHTTQRPWHASSHHPIQSDLSTARNSSARLIEFINPAARIRLNQLHVTRIQGVTRMRWWGGIGEGHEDGVREGVPEILLTLT